MRYTVILHRTVFYTDTLNFPDWNRTVSIIDNAYKCFVMQDDWINPASRPDWKPIIKDTL